MTADSIAIVLWAGGAGGAEALAIELARSFAAAGRRVEVVFVTTGEPMCERLDLDGIPYFVLGLRRGASIVSEGWRLCRHLNGGGWGAALCVAGGYLAASIRLWGYRGILVAQDHGSLLNPRAFGHTGALVKRLERLTDPLTLDGQVAVSEFMRSRVERAPHSKNLVTICNGIDTTRFRPTTRAGCPGGPLSVGWAGRLTPGKGLDVLLDAVQEAIGAGCDLRCAIAGTGPLEGWLRQEARDRRLERFVSVLGYVSDMARFWNEVDLCVTLSDSWVESFGMTVAEAMACGRAAVVTQAGGLQELVTDGWNGFLVPPGDHAAVATRLLEYAGSRELLVRQGARARGFIESELTLDKCAAQYLDLFDSLRSQRLGRR
jgi:glycosyltransferase involved in cell wall biosynthesis